MGEKSWRQRDVAGCADVTFTLVALAGVVAHLPRMFMDAMKTRPSGGFARVTTAVRMRGGCMILVHVIINAGLVVSLD